MEPYFNHPRKEITEISPIMFENMAPCKSLMGSHWEWAPLLYLLCKILRVLVVGILLVEGAPTLPSFGVSM